MSAERPVLLQSIAPATNLRVQALWRKTERRDNPDRFRDLLHTSPLVRESAARQLSLQETHPSEPGPALQASEKVDLSQPRDDPACATAAKNSCSDVDRKERGRREGNRNVLCSRAMIEKHQHPTGK